jgi:hypothetical protein
VTMSSGCVVGLMHSSIGSVLIMTDLTFFLRHNKNRVPIKITMTSGIATPMPALAPVDKTLLRGSPASRFVAMVVVFSVDWSTNWAHQERIDMRPAGDETRRGHLFDISKKKPRLLSCAARDYNIDPV